MGDALPCKRGRSHHKSDRLPHRLVNPGLVVLLRLSISTGGSENVGGSRYVKPMLQSLNGRLLR